ncbi:hypothetical protein [Adhaeribacter aquaticus]|uniref:hypothetical protein n=1 Tax=Adhaeribacter aquaticus TaxID=299567 RepID=UPI0003FD747D|nr:hypothetical protein [Adhaeribacter aquaticus]
MEATCNHCGHWNQDTEKIKAPTDAFGVCDELTGQHAMEPEYVLPLVHEFSLVDNKPKDFEMITGANFGCNHFSERKGWI